MYVCPKCNSLVDQPTKRSWSRWHYCPNGHVLYVRGLGPSLEQAFWKSFQKGLARGIGMMGLIILFAIGSILAGAFATAPPALRSAGPAYQAASLAGGMGLVVAIFYLFTGLSLLGKAHFWARRKGPVQRLVTHARGRAYGFLAAIPCQVGILIALLLAK